MKKLIVASLFVVMSASVWAASYKGYCTKSNHSFNGTTYSNYSSCRTGAKSHAKSHHNGSSGSVGCL